MKEMLTAVARATLTLLALAALPGGPALAEGPTYSLRSARKPGDIDRVVCKLEVGGEAIGTTEGGKPQRYKTSVVGNFAYDEKTLQVPTRSDDRTRSVRHYDKVDVVIKQDNKGRTPGLRPDRHLIGVDFSAGKLTVFSPKGRLTYNELILLEVPADSVLLDRLLPEKPLAVGDSWKHPPELMTGMFGLGTTRMVDVESTLTEVTDSAARFETSGHIEGTYEGTATKIDVKAKYRFNRKSRRIDWIGLLMKESRPTGKIRQGVDVVARFQMQIAPRGESPNLTSAALKGLTLSATPASTLLAYRSGNGWEFTNDRRWHVVEDARDVAQLKLLDQGQVIAQCSVSPLPMRDPDKTFSLAEFQSDIQKALGDSFKKMVYGKQYTNAANHSGYRVVCRGTVEKVPMQWNYYYLADEHGRQVVFAFTVEQHLVEHLNKADEQLVRTLRFFNRRVAKKEEK